MDSASFLLCNSDCGLVVNQIPQLADVGSLRRSQSKSVDARRDEASFGEISTDVGIRLALVQQSMHVSAVVRDGLTFDLEVRTAVGTELGQRLLDVRCRAGRRDRSTRHQLP